MPPVRRSKRSERVSTTSLTPDRNSDQQSQRCRSWVRKRSICVDVDDEDDSPEELDCLLKTTWSIYRVSPLFHCITTPERLKQYGLQLKNWLVSSGINVDVVYKAEFRICEDLRSDEYGSSALQVVVECSVAEREFKIAYFGYFVSWKLKVEPRHDEYALLPLLLCKGGFHMKTLVHRGLAKLFDGYIVPYQLSTLELLWLNGLFATLSSPRQKKKDVVFYHVIPGSKKDNKIEIRMDMKAVCEMWKCICPVAITPSTVLTIEDVTKFYDRLSNHVKKKCPFYDVMKLEFNSLEYPGVFISREGRLRCSSTIFMDHLLNFLCNESVLIEGSVVHIGHDSVGSVQC